MRDSSTTPRDSFAELEMVIRHQIRFCGTKNNSTAPETVLRHELLSTMQEDRSADGSSTRESVLWYARQLQVMRHGYTVQEKIL